MLKKNPSHHQNSLFASLSDLPDQRHSLYRLADKINRDTFEQAFSALYSSDKKIKIIAGRLVREPERNLGKTVSGMFLKQGFSTGFFLGAETVRTGFARFTGLKWCVSTRERNTKNKSSAIGYPSLHQSAG